MQLHYLACHHTAVKRTKRPQLWGVNRYHKGKWNMKSSLGWYVAYNYFIDVDGKLTKTREIGEETMANVGHNCNVPEKCDTVSVCFAMDGSTQFLNDAQEKTWSELRARHPDLEVTLHRDIQVNRICPGENVTIDYLISLLNPDEDNNKEKAKEIARLQSIVLDLLRALLAKLLGR